jgi:hypothetical protein
MDRHDVRVREPGCGTRLSQEPLARCFIVREVGRQHLDGDVAIELHIAREVDHAHSATAELALKRIFPSQRGLQGEELGGGIGHQLNTIDGSRCFCEE